MQSAFGIGVQDVKTDINFLFVFQFHFNVTLKKY